MNGMFIIEAELDGERDARFVPPDLIGFAPSFRTEAEAEVARAALTAAHPTMTFHVRNATSRRGGPMTTKT